ncbi:MAG: hypothetical protein AB8B62_14075 [Roseobacter sp.]
MRGFMVSCSIKIIFLSFCIEEVYEMKGTQFSIPLALLFAALLAQQASATHQKTGITASDDLLIVREKLKDRLDAVAKKMTLPREDSRISQWYNSRFSNRSFSNW